MKRGGRLPAMSAKRRANETEFRNARRVVLHRDHHRCVHCGAGGNDVHHRKSRARGGTNDAANLIVLCRVHHSDVHAHPDLYGRLGLLLAAWEPEADSTMWHPQARQWASCGTAWDWVGPDHGSEAVIDLHEHLLRAKVHDAIPRGEVDVQWAGALCLLVFFGVGVATFSGWLYERAGAGLVAGFLLFGAVIAWAVIRAGRRPE